MFRSKGYFDFIRLCLLLAGVVSVTVAGPSTAVAQNTGGTSPFGPNVIVINPSMTPAAINSLLNTVNQEAQFSTNRYAVLFQPGTYGTTSNPVMAQVGYYEQISGLGQNPTGVAITGGFAADQLIGGNMTQNFWRSQENMSEIPSGGLTNGVLDWGVSQGASLRRMNIRGGLWLANSGPIGSANACQESSGGFMADSTVFGVVNACSQQQWYTRNSVLSGGFTGFVWNFVFSGVLPANVPAESYPGGGTGDANVTNLATTPVSQEKPFLYVDNNGNYNVWVPAFQQNSSGATWNPGSPGNGYSMPMSSFFIATPSSALADINNALATGQSLILTPGIYKYGGSIVVPNANTIVLGMGYATIVPQTGSPAIAVADVDNVHIAGLLIDAGPVNSPVLLEVGYPGVVNITHTLNPTVLNDVFFRIGGATAGSATTSLQVDSGSVILDNIWAWRADHGNTGTVGWTVNTAAHGVVVNGTNVTALGLAVEHYQQEQVLWNGDQGETIFYQSELPYDPPNQAAWSSGTQDGYPSYVVSPGSVCTHTAFGLGIYSYFDQGINIVDDNAVTVPNVTGAQIKAVGTVFLNGSGQISNIINGTGGVVSAANASTLDPLAGYVGTGTCTATMPPAGSTVPLTTIPNPNPNNYSALNIMREIQFPHSDLTLVVSHRGVHALVDGTTPDVPENSLKSIELAAQDGIEMVEVDVKLTSDTNPQIPILSHDFNWGRETCMTNLATLDGVPFDPFQAMGSNPTNDAKNPAVTAVTKDRMRWYYADNTVLRDSISLTQGNNGFYTHGCSNTGHSLFAGAFAPTLEDAFIDMTKNRIAMVLTLDIKDPATAAAAWQVVCRLNDYNGNPYSNTTLFKIAARNFQVSDIEASFPLSSTCPEIHLFPYFGTANVKPGVFPGSPGGGDQSVIDTFKAYETSGASAYNVDALEINLKQDGEILSTTIAPAQTDAQTGRKKRVGNFSPYVEYWSPSDPNHTTPMFFTNKGYCAPCDTLADYYYNPIGSPKYDSSQPSDTGDDRGDENFMVNHGFNIITADNAQDYIKFLATPPIKQRNTCYLQAGYAGSACSTNTTSVGPANGIYTITDVNSGLAMDVVGSSKSTSVAIDQYTANGGANQQWQLTSLGAGLYQLVSVNSGLCLDVKAGSTQTGATMDQYTCNAGYANQKFAVSATSDGNYTIVASNSGLAVEVPGGATELGTVLDQWTVNGTKTQEWAFQPAVPATGTYTITNINSGLDMDVTGGSTSNSALIDQYTALAGATNQQWQLLYLTNGLYHLVSVKSGLCLDVVGGSTRAGAGIDQYTCNAGYTNQQFTLAPASVGGWTIVGKGSGLAVEVPGSSTALSKPLDQWTINQGKNQAWTFTPVN